MEDDLGWKTTFDGRETSMEDALRWKTTLYGRQLLMEDEALPPLSPCPLVIFSQFACLDFLRAVTQIETSSNF